MASAKGDTPALKCPSRFKVRTTSQFEKQGKLGIGTYGEVHRAIDKRSGTSVALKRVRMEGTREKRAGFPVSAIREIRVLHLLRHPNIVNLREVVRGNVFVDNGFKGNLYLVFEYVEHDMSGLHERLKHTHCGGSPPSLTKSLMSQMLHALAFSHSKKVLHRDIKPNNVLVGSDGALKLADFGLAKFRSEHDDLTYKICTLWFRAPELLLGSVKYGAEVDIWSTGCIFFDLLTGITPFKADNETDMLRAIMHLLGKPSWPATADIPAAESLKHYSKLPTDFPTVDFEEHFRQCCGERPVDVAALELLSSMLSLDPSKRPSATECLRHPYFSSGPPPIGAEEFRELTRDLPQSHDYNVKKDRKRLRTR
eukprot:jgi/Ulvmu1/1861/UM012_0017.1